MSVRQTLPFSDAAGCVLEPLVVAFLTEATPTHEPGSRKDPRPSKTTVLTSAITPDTASKGFPTSAPWNVTRLGMSPPPCCAVRTFTVKSPNCLCFHLQGPRIVVLSLSPLTVSIQHLATSSVNGDFWILTSLTICFSGSAVEGHVVDLDRVQFYFVRQPLIVRGALRQVGILPHWKRRTGELFLANVGRTHQISDTHHRQGSSLTSNLSHWKEVSIHAVAQGSACCKTSDCSCLQSQQSKNGDSLSRRSPLQGFPIFPQHIFACLGILVSLNQDACGNSGRVSPNQPCPIEHFAVIIDPLLPRNFQDFFSWMQMLEVLH